MDEGPGNGIACANPDRKESGGDAEAGASRSQAPPKASPGIAASPQATVRGRPQALFGAWGGTWL